jgi:AraC-like DNA-binding protein
MKPKLLKISLHPQQSFVVRHDVVPFFYKELHFHPEIELVHIVKGTGMQYVGNHLQSFKPDDMVMVGSNIPHLWKCDAEYFNSNSKATVESSVIHFLPNVFGEDFFRIPENSQIEKLLETAKHGLLILGTTKAKTSDLIKQLLVATSVEKVIILLQILNLLSTSKELTALNKNILQNNQSTKETERMNNVLQYLLNNFTETITLDEIAKVANMSDNAFCRYFKSNTKRTFSAFILELRINHACKLLSDTNKAVADICFECGFNNFSNFNRYFKQLTKYSPLQYKKLLTDN